MRILYLDLDALNLLHLSWYGGTAANPKRRGKSRGFRSVYEEKSLARKLHIAGYHTAMISPFGQRHAAHPYGAGYREIHNTGKGSAELAEGVTPVIDQ